MIRTMDGPGDADRIHVASKRMSQRRPPRSVVTYYQAADRVQVFMADVQRTVPGTVTAATTSCVHVALDDRMVPVAVDPANRFLIQPVMAVA